MSVVSIGSLLGSKEQAVIWKGPRKTNMIKRFLKDVYWGKLDILFFDTPPGSITVILTQIQAPLTNISQL